MAPASLETVRIEALFVSDLQYPDALTTEAVRDAVLDSVRRYGPSGCGALVAVEFDQRPDQAVARMSWVRSAIRALYPHTSLTPPRRPTPTPIAA